MIESACLARWESETARASCCSKYSRFQAPVRRSSCGATSVTPKILGYAEPGTPVADPGNSDFPPCPVTVEDGQGYPQFGTYRGSLPEVDLTRLRGPYALPPPRRWFKHKRWQYGMVSTPNVLAVFSVADLTYIDNAFACAVDLTAKKLLFDRGWMGVPGPWISVGNRPGLNARARFLMPGVRFAFGPIEQARQYRVEVESYGKPWAKPVFALKVQLVSPPEPSPLTPRPSAWRARCWASTTRRAISPGAPSGGGRLRMVGSAMDGPSASTLRRESTKEPSKTRTQCGLVRD